LSAIFPIEHLFSLDIGDTAGGNIFLLPGQTNASGNNKFWNAGAWAGLKGAWGQVSLGRQYTPLFDALAPADFSAYWYYNNWQGTQGDSFGGTVGGTAPIGPIRTDNSIKYVSPGFGGLTYVWPLTRRLRPPIPWPTTSVMRSASLTASDRILLRRLGSFSHPAT
jgi:predicted porin